VESETANELMTCWKWGAQARSLQWLGKIYSRAWLNHFFVQLNNEAIIVPYVLYLGILYPKYLYHNFSLFTVNWQWTKILVQSHKGRDSILWLMQIKFWLPGLKIWLVPIYSMTHNLSTVGLAWGLEACPNDCPSSTSTLLFFSQKETLIYRARTLGRIVIYFFILYVAHKAIAGCTTMKNMAPTNISYFTVNVQLPCPNIPVFCI
jgi:hypothetical protein